MSNLTDPVVKTPFRIQQGEHFLITGKTGSGKSQLAASLLASRPDLLVFRSKSDKVSHPVDKRVTTLKSSLSAMDDPRTRRIEIHPKPEDQAQVFYEVMEKAYEKRGWCIYVDETFHLHKHGKWMQDELEKLLTQGRSLGISMVLGTQRPVWISRFSLSEVSHKISFWCEGRDRKTLRDEFGDGHYNAISQLGKYEFCWTHGLPPRTWVGRLQELQ